MRASLALALCAILGSACVSTQADVPAASASPPPSTARGLASAASRRRSSSSKRSVPRTTRQRGSRQPPVFSLQSAVFSRQERERRPSPQPSAPSPSLTPRVWSSWPTSRPPAAGGAGTRGFRRPGSGLYVSVVLAPATATDPARATTLLTLAAGVALAEGIEQATGLRVDLKWPNDLQVSRGASSAASSPSRPAPAIDSTPSSSATASTCGRRRFPPELRDRATSLESELGRAVDRHHLLAETLAALVAALRGSARRPVRCYSRRVAAARARARPARASPGRRTRARRRHHGRDRRSRRAAGAGRRASRADRFRGGHLACDAASTQRTPRTQIACCVD